MGLTAPRFPFLLHLFKGTPDVIVDPATGPMEPINRTDHERLDGVGETFEFPGDDGHSLGMPQKGMTRIGMRSDRTSSRSISFVDIPQDLGSTSTGCIIPVLKGSPSHPAPRVGRFVASPPADKAIMKAWTPWSGHGPWQELNLRVEPVWWRTQWTE
ncbi:hypothetical protein N7539_009102 [Penicillium diatomitis]|uniref:Uncharacterized protein n=1 Tax=Penicillium diatomitis TaxID=2819901 RepID=A0A9W9WL46_9EURO|nr:uncharacterized protein N7539_009102 [Penicillium diatomitis]KAJ5469484.1 hypothetical protein N7539_009102 [Penicillium diatomitis]